jgi:hypothetical protein
MAWPAAYCWLKPGLNAATSRSAALYPWTTSCGNFQTSNMQARERMAYSPANLAAGISPAWHFRPWIRLVGGVPHRNDAISSGASREILPHGNEREHFDWDWTEVHALSSGPLYEDGLCAVIEAVVRPGEIILDQAIFERFADDADPSCFARFQRMRRRDSFDRAPVPRPDGATYDAFFRRHTQGLSRGNH